MGCTQCERSGTKTDFLTEKITSYEQMFEAIKNGHKLFVLEDTVIDLDSFSAIHPGGSDVLKSYIGKLHYFKFKIGTEVSRFYYGGFQGLSKEVHNHTGTAFSIARNLSAGIIRCNLQQKIFKPIKPQYENMVEHEKWKVCSKKMVSGVHAVFQFRSPNFKVAGMLPFFDHCGKYYTVFKNLMKLLVALSLFKNEP